MFPLLGPLISGGASLLGSMFSSQTNASNTQQQIAAQEQMQNQTEQFNAQQADINRQYQTQMSSTAYQRASQDMKDAGLNPMMMFGSGGPSSSPSGSTASVGTPNVPMPSKTSPLAGLGNAAATAVDTMVKDKQMDLLSSEVAKLSAEKDLTISQTGESMQRKAIAWPTEQRAGMLGRWQMNYPNLAEAATIGPHIGKAVDETLSAPIDILSQTLGKWGVLGNAARSVAPSPGSVSTASTGSSANAVRRGMDIEGQMRDRALQSDTYRDWNKRIDKVREEFEANNPGFQGEGR